jgi:hypothetical protein
VDSSNDSEIVGNEIVHGRIVYWKNVVRENSGRGHVRIGKDINLIAVGGLTVAPFCKFCLNFQVDSSNGLEIMHGHQNSTW